jgi:D-arabinose 1-dehydrogenase-like Zn-dependent alcohol dehydrogenase
MIFNQSTVIPTTKSSRQARVLWLNGPFALEFKDQDLGVCGDDQIYCETLVTVISPGTELAAFTGIEPLRDARQYPRLQGYCNVAEVKEIGNRVEHLKPGDRVLTFQSHRTAFIAKSSDILYLLRPDQDAYKVACAYLYHLGYNALLRADVKVGSRVLIIGFGALGTTTLQMCRVAGAVADVISDNTLAKQQASALGAREVYSRADFDKNQMSGAQPIHYVVITTVNGWDDWKRALIAIRKLGTIAMLVFPGRGESSPDFNPLDPKYVYSKQLRIESVGESPQQNDSRGFLRFNEIANLSFIIDCIDSATIDTFQIASHRFHYSEIGLAYNALSQRTLTNSTAWIEWKK